MNKPDAGHHYPADGVLTEHPDNKSHNRSSMLEAKGEQRRKGTENTPWQGGTGEEAAHAITGEDREKAKQVAGGKHSRGRGKRKAQKFSGVGMHGVLAERREAGVAWAEGGRGGEQELREEAAGSSMQGFLRH